MCQLIYLPPGKRFEYEEMEETFSINKDGAGFAFPFADEIHSYKTVLGGKRVNSLDDFYRKYDEAASSCALSPFMLHFRFATHGLINEDNCHPYLVSSGDYTLAVAHNGVFPLGSKDDPHSDSFYFAKFLETLKPEFWFDPVTMNILDGFVSNYGSKVAMMISSGSTFIFNREAGVWDDKGRWFSNLNHIKRQIPSVGIKRQRCSKCRQKRWTQEGVCFQCIDKEKEGVVA